MTDWIDKYLYDDAEQTAREEKRRNTLLAMAQRYWESLCQMVTQHATKLNRTAMTRLKSAIEINNRELVASNNELDVDRLAFPAIRLTILLDLYAESIKITQVRIETPESDYQETTERIQLELINGAEIAFIPPDGERRDLEGMSKYILERFLRN